MNILKNVKIDRDRMIDIFGQGQENEPKTVRQITQLYYGKGAYNKRKDSRIRRALDELLCEGMLAEEHINGVRVFQYCG